MCQTSIKSGPGALVRHNEQLLCSALEQTAMEAAPAYIGVENMEFRSSPLFAVISMLSSDYPGGGNRNAQQNAA